MPTRKPLHPDVFVDLSQWDGKYRGRFTSVILTACARAGKAGEVFDQWFEEADSKDSNAHYVRTIKKYFNTDPEKVRNNRIYSYEMRWSKRDR